MNIKRAKRALQQVAKRDGVSIRTVRREIEIAIATALKKPDPKAKAFWLSIPHKGEYPTPEEVIAYIADMANNQYPYNGRYKISINNQKSLSRVGPPPTHSK